MPSKVGLGTSLPQINPGLVPFEDPVTGEKLLAVRALKSDIAILSAAYSDAYGNVRHIGTGFGDRALARASSRTIVQVEKIVSNEEIKGNPGATSVSGVDAVVRAPYGSHPGSSPGFYLEDVKHMKFYVEAANRYLKLNEKRYMDDYLQKYVYEPDSHLDYLEVIGARDLFSLSEY
jgi:hypothetical protein